MKLMKRLFISNQEVVLASSMVSLKLSLGGVGIFKIQGVKPEKFELVRFDIGYENKTKPWFEGFIDKIQPAENGYHKITVRELSGVLAKKWPMSIEHPTAKNVIDQVASLTGLEFKLPASDYMTTTIPNFVCHGTGYQCLEQVGKAFNIPDFVWFQDTNQELYLGSYKDCHFFDKPMPIPEEFTSRQNGNSVTFPPFPMLRPGRMMNGQRITRVDLIQDEMTAYWKVNENEVSAQKKETLQHFPELAAGFHLPQFGRVVAVRDNAVSGQTADPFRPRYAVDVQLLNEDFLPDESVPVYRSIPLPVHMSGHESGLFAYPLEGTLVEVAFAYGRNDRPIVRGVYGRDYALPSIEPGEQLQQQRDEVSRRIDAAGNITDKTDQTLTTQAFERVESADRYRAEVGACEITVNEHSIEHVVGKKRLEVLGAVELLAGDNMELGSLGNLHMATAGELVTIVGMLRNIVIAQDDKLNVLGNRIESITKDWEANAANMRFTANLITMNGGKGVVQGDCICAFTGKPHSDLSSTVTAGK